MTKANAVDAARRDGYQMGYDVGKREGRKEVFAEIHKALGIDELIAKAIEDHERGGYHE